MAIAAERIVPTGARQIRTVDPTATHGAARLRRGRSGSAEALLPVRAASPEHVPQLALASLCRRWLGLLLHLASPVLGGDFEHFLRMLASFGGNFDAAEHAR